MKVLIITLFLGDILFGAILEFQTLSTNFIQTVKNKSAKEIVYKGEFKAKGKDKVLWKYQKPIVKNIYIDKNRVIIDEPDLEQAITSTLSDELNLVKIINNSKKVASNQYVNTLENTKYTILIENNLPKSVQYDDELGNAVSIVFSNFIKNTPINDSIFEFKIPSHYDVIRK